MKSKNHCFKWFTFIFLTTGILGASLPMIASADTGAALTQAKGEYKGTVSGSASGVGLSIPATPATLKMPRGKGKVKISIDGMSAFQGKVTKVKCTQGGNKIVSNGKTLIPAEATGGLGAITGPFKAVTKLNGRNATIKAKTAFSALGVDISGVFKGSK